MNKHLFQSTRFLLCFTLLLLILLTFRESIALQQPLRAKEPDYFPLAVGNEWRYAPRIPCFPEIRRITGTKNIDGHTYYVLATWELHLNREELVSEGLYRKDEKNQVLFRIKDREIVWLKLSADLGEVWEIQFPGVADISEATLLKKDVEVDTFAGRFVHCMIFRFYSKKFVDGDVLVTLAPNVGIVETTSPGGALALSDYTLFPNASVKPLGKLITIFGQLKQWR